MSHEFLVLAETGESEIACHKDFLHRKLSDTEIDFDADLQPIVDDYTSQYAATDEKRDLNAEAKLGEDLVNARGIEVGHIFNFGTKYSKPLALVEKGRLFLIKKCENRWCKIETGRYSGWIEKKRLKGRL